MYRTDPDVLTTPPSQDHHENISLNEVEELRAFMKNFHCPFTWDLVRMENRDNFISKIEEKVEETAEDNELILPWPTLYSNLVLCYEHCCNGCFAEAEMRLTKLESFVKEDDENIPGNGLKHVISSCKCFLLLEQGKHADVREILDEIEEYELMNRRNQACVVGLRAGVCTEYGCEGDIQSLTFSQKAMELDPSEAEWPFLQGMALCRIRRIERPLDIPDDKEIHNLEKANELFACVPYMIFLAQVYREKSTKLWEHYQDDYSKVQSNCDNYNTRVTALYKNALDLRKECPRVNIRCAQGFLMLPFNHRDMKLAFDCIQKALELAPDNIMVHHVAGKYYMKTKCAEKARYHLQIAAEGGAFGASSDLIRLNWTSKSGYRSSNWEVAPNYDVLQQFKELLMQYRDKTYQHHTLCQIGSYWYFIQGNFKEALKCWIQVLDEDPSAHALWKHKPLLIELKTPINICEIIFNETQILLNSKSATPEDCELMKKLMQDLSQGSFRIYPTSPREIILKNIKKAKQEKRIKKQQRKMSEKGQIKGDDLKDTVETNWRIRSPSGLSVVEQQTEKQRQPEKKLPSQFKPVGSNQPDQIQRDTKKQKPESREMSWYKSDNSHGQKKEDWRCSSAWSEVEEQAKKQRQPEKKVPYWFKAAGNNQPDRIQRDMKKQKPERREMSWRNPE